MNLTLGQAIDRKNNNFNLIRLLAAMLVVFGHSFYLFPTNGYNEPIVGLLKGDYTGSLAVFIFFFLSGIFIVSSFVNSKTFVQFTLMRVFRIYPALIICNIITVFFVGACVTTLSLGRYFSSGETWHYIIYNSFMFKFADFLPGVFKDNLYKGVVNGSLWTLPTEIRCYFLTMLLGALGCFKKNIIVVRVTIFFFAFILFRYNSYVTAFFQGGEIKALFFLIGMLAYTFRNYLIISKKAALFLIAVCIGSYFISFKFFINVFYLTLIYSILVVATLSTVKKIKLPGDYSYGIYIYGFLVQQIMAYSFPKLTSYPSMLISFPIVCFLGIISWHYIESPALKMARHLSKEYQESSEFYSKDRLVKDIASN